jgi:hypothetical protein
MATLAVEQHELSLRPGLDFPTLTYAYCRWKGEGVFKDIFYQEPDALLVDFLGWNMAGAVEALGLYDGDTLWGMGWVNQKYEVDGVRMAEVGVGFFKGVPLSIWRRALDLMLTHAFIEVGLEVVYGLCPTQNRAAMEFIRKCRMTKVDKLPWGQEVGPEVGVYELRKDRWLQ